MQLDAHRLEEIADRLFPSQNKLPDDENFPAVLADLQHFGITTMTEFEELVGDHLANALREDQAQARYNLEHKPRPREKKRAQNGIWYTHTGLIREMLRRYDPDKWARFSGEDRLF